MEGISPGIRIFVKKILVKYNRSYILQVDTRLEMAETSGKGHAFATALPGGMHELLVVITVSCSVPNILPADL